MADLEARGIPAGLEEQRSLLRGLQRAMGPAFAEEVAAISGSTAELARAVKPPLSLAQARTALEGRVDFEKLQERTARDFERWGLDAGFEFKDDMTVGDSGDVNKLKALFEGGRQAPSALVVPDGLKPAALLDILFVKAGVPMNRNSYGFQNLDALREIDPRNVPGLATLHTLSYQEQMAALATAYEKAPDLHAGGSRILFTDDSPHAKQAVGESATVMLQRTAAGEVSWIDPAAEYIRARQMVDAALKQVVGEDVFESFSPDAYRSALVSAFEQRTIDPYMPQWANGSVTRNPLHVFPNGGVSALYWYPDLRYFSVGSGTPASDDDSLGGRASPA